MRIMRTATVFDRGCMQ